ncbi:hypothetical protein MXM41_03050 [Leclercia adecarboxylata]|uniref:VasL domain-containing protein n=1 Tax=Leclercia adecarboxylata TaxID=83655 RepID=UPI002DBD82A5|nr:VasL domain-containing protein [Leclercia adecarboxylata]MEB6377925.1 hypothetical protein [Leclercia adecarboxylata]
MAALVIREWGNLWPQPVHARKEILNTLSKRLQRVLRTLDLTHADADQLKLAEDQLRVLDEALERLDAIYISQLDTLRAHLRSAAVRLGTCEERGNKHPVCDSVPVETLSKPTECIRIDLPIHPETPSAVMPPAKPWKPFAAGALTMLVLGGGLLLGWQTIHRPDPAQGEHTATLAPLPATLSGAQLQSLRQSPQSALQGMSQTRQQLAGLITLKPDWALSYGDNLVQQARRLWPEQGAQLAQQWQQQKVAITLRPESLAGWHQGITQLEQLAARLNALDEQKGKYMTVSELKSVVFAVQQSLNRTVPAEEQLRQLSLISAGQASNAILQNQVEQHLQQLIASYAALKHYPAE